MELIGERINGMFSDIKEAIINKDPRPVEFWARSQAEKGADYLDLSTGPAVPASEQPLVMEWLVKTVQGATGLPCCLDSTNPEAIEAGLKVHRGRAIINSTSADQDKINLYFPMALKYNAKIIGLTMNEKGIPKDAASRIALAMELVVGADMHGLAMRDLYIDPLVLPVNVAQDHCPEVIETIRQIKLLADPPPRTIIGLSNVSQRCSERRLLNRTFLVMCMSAGLDSCILDVEDDELLKAAAAASVLLNREVYCDAFIKTFRR